MIDVRVDRITVTCPAAGRSRADVDRCRMRTGRLSRIARDRLAGVVDAALDKRITWAIDIERLSVAIDFDIDAHDDETVALLWADRIVSAIEHHIVAPPHSRPSPELTMSPVGNAADVVSQATLELEAWVLAVVRECPIELRRVLADDPTLAVKLYRSVDVTVRRAMMFDVTVDTDDRSEVDGLVDIDDQEDIDPAEPGSSREPSPPQRGRNDTDRSDCRASPFGSPTDDNAHLVAFLDRMSAAATATDDGAVSEDVEVTTSKRLRHDLCERLAAHDRLDTSIWTSVCAGLVLLYPWFSSLFAAAELLDEDIETGRRVGLSHLAVGSDALVDDPLVIALSGIDLVERPAPPRSSDRHPLAEQIVGAYDRLAQHLPGFEASSVGYLRDALIVRHGALEMIGAALRLHPVHLPLDPLLSMLPYPISLVQLPWTRPLQIAWTS